MNLGKVLAFEPKESRNVKKRKEVVIKEMRGTLPVLLDLREFLIAIVEKVDSLHKRIDNSIQLMEGGDN